MTTTPREAPVGHKPSGRQFNRGEQTVEGGITYRPTVREGKPIVEITNPTDFNRTYARSAKLFGGEAHHMADLAYIDKLLHRAGLSSGAHGSKNYSDERHRVLEMVNKKGAKTGDHIDNLMTLAQHGKKGSVQKYGQAHKFSHDLYKQIPELPDEQLRAMSLEELADYMVGQIRVRKKIVIDAAQYKLDQLYNLKPELRDAPESQVREFIANPKNRKLVGELGDSGFFDHVKVTPLKDIPAVKGGLPGHVAIEPRTNMILRGDPRGFISADPVVQPCVKGGNVCIMLTKRKPSIGLPVTDIVAGTALKLATDPDINAGMALRESVVDTAQELITDYNTSAVETTELGNGARVGHDKDRNIVYPTAGVEESNGNKGIAVLNGKNVLVERGSVAGIKPDYQVAFDNAAGFLKLVTTGLSKRIENALDAVPSPYKPTEIPNR